MKSNTPPIQSECCEKCLNFGWVFGGIPEAVCTNNICPCHQSNCDCTQTNAGGLVIHRRGCHLTQQFKPIDALWEEELQFGIMEDYLFAAERIANPDEMRGHYDKLKAFIRVQREAAYAEGKDAAEFDLENLQYQTGFEEGRETEKLHWHKQIPKVYEAGKQKGLRRALELVPKEKMDKGVNADAWSIAYDTAMYEIRVAIEAELTANKQV